MNDVMGDKFHWIKTTAPHQKVLPGLLGGRWSILNGHTPMQKPMQSSEVAAAVNTITDAYNQSVKEGHPMEINIVGFSYGSAVTAQAVLQLAENGIPVNSVVLAKSMIDKDSELYKKLETVTKVLVSDNEVTDKAGNPLIDVVSNASGTNMKEARKGWRNAAKSFGKGHAEGKVDRAHPYRIIKDLFIKEPKKDNTFQIEKGKYSEKAKEVVTKANSSGKR